jgi:hypothetical protein
VYVAARVPDSAELRIRAISLVVRSGHIACDRTAAWMHGVNVFGLDGRDSVGQVQCAEKGKLD